EGSIGHDMVIKPLPHELSPQPEESHHVIYKRSVEQMEHLSDFAYMEPDDMGTHEKLEKLQERQKRAAHFNTLADIEEEQEELEAEDGVNFVEHSTHKRAKRSAPYMIYPEVLVIVDYDGYRLHGGDNLQVKRYFIAFWNGVDLRYRLLKEPKIRVSIAGIIISRGRDATPYLERNRVGRDAIDSAAALTDMGKYLFRERRLPVYDIAVAITKLDMCRREVGARDCNRGTAGFAYVGGACVVNRRLEKVNSVAIIEDTGGFSGIIVAAHEVGHLLGAVHDGSPPPSYLGGPGAQRCRWEDGFIMSDLRHTERGFRWSACSVQSFQHFLNGATATCLYNVPHEDNALGRSLPGTLLSLDAQCRRDRGTYACFKDERVCAQLFCFDAQTGYCVAYRPAAEGSTCGNNMHCLDGRCTALPVASNLITNYGGQYNRGYKSNEAIGDDNETKDNSSQSNNSETEEDEEDDEDDDEEEPEDEDADEEEEDEEEEDEKNENQAHDNSSGSSDEGLQEIEPKNIEEENDEQEEDQSEENTSDAYESREQDNSSSASPRGFGENDDDEEYLTDDENIEEPLNKHVDEHHNYIDKPHPHDNRYEETMVKRKDNERDHRERTSTTPVFNLNTYQYLSQLWQNLQTFTSTTTTTTTTKKPKTVLQKHTPLQQQPDYDDFKSLIRSGMSLKGFSDSRRNVTTTRNTLQQQHYTDITSTPRNIRTPPPPHLSNRITTTTTTRPTPEPTSNFIKTLRKQFQYYVKLLQTNNSNNNNDFSNRRSTSSSIRSTTKPKTTTTTTLTSINKTNYNSHTILPSKPYSNNSVNNAASKQGSANNENGGGGGDDDDEDDDDDDDDDDNDSGDDNDESNETIEKQKRKLNIPISTTTMQQQQPLQASPHHPTPSTSYKAPTSAATDTPQAAAPHYGIRSVVSNPTLFETYIKKLQALNDEDDGDVEVDEVTEATLTRTTSDGQSKTLDKTERTIHPTAQLGGGDFFKRTPSSSSGSSSISSHNKSPYAKQSKTTTTGRGSTSANGSSFKFISPQQQQHQALKIIAETERQTSSPAVGYVTNYIGDNTNRLASIVQNQQQPQHHHHPQHQTQTLYQQQQQQKTYSKLMHQKSAATSSSSTGSNKKQQHPQYSSTTATATTTTTQSTSTIQATTRRPKIKTQKLIRRLRTQIK
uniref:Uncharacterized protein n=1 Tax=Musca domestica TaxID=7370 RepID=A0A1I8MX25_MUSDO